MTNTESYEDAGFLEWWHMPEQDRLRKHCAPNWAFIIWRASREAIEIEMPARIITSEIGLAVSLEKMISRLAVNGIKVKP